MVYAGHAALGVASTGSLAVHSVIRENTLSTIFGGTIMILSVVETAYFVKTATDIWSDDERERIVAWLPTVYESGDVIKNSGTLRKIRVPIQGQGKRGGARLIYFVKRADGEIWLLAAYKKSVADSLSPVVLKLLKELTK